LADADAEFSVAETGATFCNTATNRGIAIAALGAELPAVAFKWIEVGAKSGRAAEAEQKQETGDAHGFKNRGMGRKWMSCHWMTDALQSRTLSVLRPTVLKERVGFFSEIFLILVILSKKIAKCGVEKDYLFIPIFLCKWYKRGGKKITSYAGGNEKE